MKIHILNPLSDRRWDELVARHPKASVFHQRGWLESLARTYGYEPFVLTSAPAGEPLENGLVLCRVSSWITGSRLVSVPFADHCEPLFNDLRESQDFMNWLRAECDLQQRRYAELRPLLGVEGTGNGLQPSRSYWFHELDLKPSLEQIFRGLHKNSFRRKIQRAERERLSYEAGRSEKLVDELGTNCRSGWLGKTVFRSRPCSTSNIDRPWFTNMGAPTKGTTVSAVCRFCSGGSSKKVRRQVQK